LCQFGECTEGTYIQKPGFEAVVEIEPAVELRGCCRSVEAAIEVLRPAVEVFEAAVEV
jgi:hypothetical protein